MSAIFPLNLPLDVGCDFSAIFTCYGDQSTQIALDGATAQASFRATELDATPLFTVSTTSNANGQLVLGVALPGPVGANCATLEAMQELGMPTLSQDPPDPVTLTVATTAALAAKDTTGLASGVVAFVATGAWFAWSPGDANTPNGTTVIATTSLGPVGNWLYCGTLSIFLTATATGLLSGLDQAFYDLIVTWGNGIKTKFLGGTTPISQTETH